MWRKVVLFIGLTLMFAEPVVAQTQTIRRLPAGAQNMSGEVAADVAINETPDGLERQVVALRSQIKALTAQTQTLQSQVRDLGAAQVSYQCLDQTHSANNKGVTEDCSAYACNAIDGRCRAQCTSTDMCSPGYVCDIGSRNCLYVH